MDISTSELVTVLYDFKKQLENGISKTNDDIMTYASYISRKYTHRKNAGGQGDSNANTN